MFQLIMEGQGLSGLYEWRSSANVTREMFVIITRRPSYDILMKPQRFKKQKSKKLKINIKK